LDNTIIPIGYGTVSPSGRFVTADFICAICYRKLQSFSGML
jgi:hypothetical protein